MKRLSGRLLTAPLSTSLAPPGAAGGKAPGAEEKTGFFAAPAAGR